MSKLNQKEGVFQAVCSVTEQDVGLVSFEGAVTLTKEQRATVIEIVTTGLSVGEIEMSAAARTKYDDDAKMKTYTNGLVSNWLKKDKRLNGGVKHAIQNPGSRAGSGDKVIKELRKLASTLTDPAQVVAVTNEIDKRLATLKAEKTKNVEINMDLIPDDLKELING